MRLSIRSAFGLCLGAMTPLAVPALAQDLSGGDSAATSADSASESEGEEVIVYGRGTKANASATGLDLTPRQTPQSISIITREQIEDQSAARISDVLEYTTGLSVKRVDRGRNLLSARGFDITNFQIDGIPVTTGNVGLEESSTAIFERVEVIRGSTGLLQGAGEPSASINMIRKHADSDVLTGELTVEAGSWNRLSAMGDVTAPLTEDGSVRIRLVAEAYSQDAYVDLESSKGFTLYSMIDADLGADTRLSVGASYQEDRRDDVMWSQLPYWFSDGTRTDWSRSKTTGADWNEWDTNEVSAFTTLEHDFGGGWTVRGDVTYNRQVEDSKLNWFNDSGVDPVTGLGIENYGYWYLAKPEQWSVNLQAKGGYTLFGHQHELVVGAMYSHLSTGWTNRDPDPATTAPTGNFFEWDGSYPEPEWGARYRMSGYGTTQQSAVYGATRVSVTDSLTVIAGGRLSNYKRDEEEALYTAAPYTVEKGGVFTPYAGIIYDFDDNFSAYASYTSIFNPQTARDRNGRYLDPLEGNSYEAGLKADLMDGRLRASAAIFRIEQDNFAIPDIGYYVPGTTDVASRAGDGVVSEGYEFEVQGEVLPGWDVSAGWSDFKAQDADGFDVQAHQPRRVFRMATKYQFEGDLNRLSVGGSLRWESQPPQTATNPGTDLVEKVGQKPYTLVNLFADFQMTEQVSVQVNVDNIFDETYYNTNSWFGGFIYGEPRNARVTLRYSF